MTEKKSFQNADKDIKPHLFLNAFHSRGRGGGLERRRQSAISGERLMLVRVLSHSTVNGYFRCHSDVLKAFLADGGLVSTTAVAHIFPTTPAYMHNVKHTIRVIRVVGVKLLVKQKDMEGRERGEGGVSETVNRMAENLKWYFMKYPSGDNV